MISSQRLVIQTTLYIFWQIICFFCGRQRLECIKNIANFLTSFNIIYSKIFQSLSTGANILTLDEIKYLSHFNDCVPYSHDDTYNIYDIINELNCMSNYKDVLILKPNIQPKSGMISVVYYGRLGDNDVVIKVKRRGVKEKLVDGIDKMEYLVWITSYVPYLYKLNLQVILQENKLDMLNQCDFNIELNNMKLMKHKFRNINYVKIPIAYEEYTKLNSDVIVMEQIKGKKLHDSDFLKNNDLKSSFGLLVAKFNMKTIFYDRLYHADLHAGNIFFDDSIPNNFKIGIIDFGLVGKISKLEQEKIFLFFKKILVDNDEYSAAQVILNHLVLPKNIYTQMNNSSTSLLNYEIATIAKELLINSNRELDIGTIYKINNILYKYGMTLSREFSKIQLSLAISGNVCNELCSTGPSYIELVIMATKDMAKCVETINTNLTY